MIESSTTTKTFSSNWIEESIHLIETLSKVVQECPICLNKLKSQLDKNNAGVTSPSQDTATIATNQANYYDL
ncbi:MAG TPA: hypothetical protein VH415_02560 [Nitrososphaeraceae archaeon]